MLPERHRRAVRLLLLCHRSALWWPDNLVTFLAELPWVIHSARLRSGK
jgi:hypothetical protein